MGCNARTSSPEAIKERDREALERACGLRDGNIWREPLRKAMKRAGARVYRDENGRLMVEYGPHCLHISRLDLGMTEDVRAMRAFGPVAETTFEMHLRRLATALLEDAHGNRTARPHTTRGRRAAPLVTGQHIGHP